MPQCPANTGTYGEKERCRRPASDKHDGKCSKKHTVCRYPLFNGDGNVIAACPDEVSANKLRCPEHENEGEVDAIAVGMATVTIKQTIKVKVARGAK